MRAELSHLPYSARLADVPQGAGPPARFPGLPEVWGARGAVRLALLNRCRRRDTSCTQLPTSRGAPSCGTGARILPGKHRGKEGGMEAAAPPLRPPEGGGAPSLPPPLAPGAVPAGAAPRPSRANAGQRGPRPRRPWAPGRSRDRRRGRAARRGERSGRALRPRPGAEAAGGGAAAAAQKGTSKAPGSAGTAETCARRRRPRARSRSFVAGRRAVRGWARRGHVTGRREGGRGA